MSTFRLKVTTPDRVFFDGDVEKIILRTTAGDTGIMHDHINYVATLRIGKLIVKTRKDAREATISGGVIEMSNGVANVLTTAAEWIDEIDIERAVNARKRAEENLRGNNLSKNESRINEAALRRAVNRINSKGL